MAIYNEILAGRFARGIQKIFSMKGVVPTRQLSGEVMATYQLDKATALENRFPHSIRSFAYSKTVAAGGVATFAAVRLRNPAGSGTIATIEKFMTGGSVASQVQLFRGPTGSGDLVTNDSANESIRDVRMGNVSGSVIASFGTPAGNTGVQWAFLFQPANSQVDLILDPNQEFVIGPNDIVQAIVNTANQTQTFTFFWRERTLEESELTA